MPAGRNLRGVARYTSTRIFEGKKEERRSSFCPQSSALIHIHRMANHEADRVAHVSNIDCHRRLSWVYKELLMNSSCTIMSYRTNGRRIVRESFTGRVFFYNVPMTR